jgi:hypothetical protein
VDLGDALRAAISEVEGYSRVQLIPHPECALHPHAAADIIHMVAELLDNATRLSPPHTQIVVRAQVLASGLVIDVVDRGVGIKDPAELQRINDILTGRSRIDVEEFLRDGRIGIPVVAALARRQDTKVELQASIYGGIQASMMLPQRLILLEPREGADPRMTLLPAAAGSAAGSVASSVASSAGISPAAATPAPAGEPVTAPVTAPVSEPAQPARSGAAARPHARPPVPDGTGGNKGDGMGDGREGGAWERPPLPRRLPQASLPPELLAAPVTGEPTEMTPGLMAAFQRGVGRSADESRPGGDDRPFHAD